LDEIEKKIQTAIGASGYDAVIAVGVANFTYVSGVVLPFALNYPDRQAAVVKTKEGQGCAVCPFDWSQAIRDQGWEGDIVAYDENKGLPPRAFVEALVEVLSQMGLDKGKIGLDKSRASAHSLQLLERRLPGVELASCDDMFRQLRIIKTREEVDLLETAAKESDKGIIAALMHLEGTVDTPGYTLSEFSDRVRVHIFEYGGSGVGHLATMQGVDAQLFYAPQRGKVRGGELIRIDVTNHHRGYWSNAGRMAVTGKPTDEQSASYSDNLVLKAAAAEMLRPGVRCVEVFEGVRKTAAEKQIRFWEDVGVGHGVGVSHREAPYLDRYDETPLREGMVLALDIYTFGPRQELIHSKDTYEVVEDGCRLLSWYKNWDRLYEVTGFRSTH